MTNDLNASVTGFLKDVTKALGLALEVSVEVQEDHTRMDLEGSGGEVLLRRKAEALDALQQS
jgi:predicted RNA-binding protein Jag